MSPVDPSERPRSHTLQRLFAAGTVMAACLVGGIGLSAMVRSPGLDALSDTAFLDDGSPPPASVFGRETDPSELAARREFEAARARAERAQPSDPGATATPGESPDFSLDPAYGSVSLRAGFAPDPHTLEVRAGGQLDAGSIGSECRGFVAQAPDVRLNYVAGSGPLIIAVTSEADTTLVVNGPDGSWYCDDDSGGGGNPRIRFTAPQTGQYDVWVGTYGAGALQPSRLSFSELD
jgi:hypothetical protein